MKIHLLTLTNKSEHPNVKNLIESVDVTPDCLHVIHDYDPSLKNLSKIYKIPNYVMSCDTIADTDIICVVDAHDVIFNKKLFTFRDVLQKFINLDVEVVFSTENKCSHHTPAAKAYFQSTCKNRYLNSGVIIAYKKHYVTLFSDIVANMSILNSPHQFSDQRVIGQYLQMFRSNLPVKVHLDTDDTFALTMNSSRDVADCDISSPFVHITFLANLSQLRKYNNFLSYIR